MAKPNDYVFTFAGVGTQRAQCRGRYLRILEADGDVFIKLDGTGNEMKRRAGQQIADTDPTGFTRIEVRSAIAQTVRLVVADAPQDDSSTSLDATVTATVAGSTAVTPKTIVTIPAGNKAKVADSNADRVELRVAIKSDAAGEVYLGDSTLVAGEGGILEPGMVDYLATTAEVWAYNPGADDVDVSVLDLEAP